jgi:dihydroorotate dehydrogenase electron transfer subunit
MTLEMCPVTDVREAGQSIFVLSFTSPAISRSLRPGQFLNIKVAEGTDPLLRRPFSAYRVDGATVAIIFNVIGRGTSALHRKRPGDVLDVLGPLGTPFGIDAADFETGVLIAGGLGVAPLPLATAALVRAGKSVVTFLGGRSAGQIVANSLVNLQVATDDGSMGLHGTVVELAEKILTAQPVPRPKIFACGPTPMLRAVAVFARKAGIPCEVSLEGPMGCGIGICQGCPVELDGEEKKYVLMCREGPTFDIRSIKI